MSFVQGNLRRQAWWLLPCACACFALASRATAVFARPEPAAGSPAPAAVPAPANTATPPSATPDAAPEPEESTSDEKKDAKPATKSIAEIMIKSGWVGIAFYGILFVFSIISLTVALERLFNLRRGKILPPKFRRALSDLLIHHAGKADELRRLCETSDSPISRILRAGVLRAGRSLAEVEKSMEDAAAAEIADLRGRNRLLYVLGNVGPLIGLLGTVVGMIVTFNAAAEKGLGQGQALAEGIYLALLCTAGGLAIAIPSLIVAALLNTRAERLMREVVECVNETLPIFMRIEAARPKIGEDESNGKTPAEFTLPRAEESKR